MNLLCRLGVWAAGKVAVMSKQSLGAAYGLCLFAFAVSQCFAQYGAPEFKITSFELQFKNEPPATQTFEDFVKFFAIFAKIKEDLSCSLW